MALLAGGGEGGGNHVEVKNFLVTPPPTTTLHKCQDTWGALSENLRNESFCLSRVNIMNMSKVILKSSLAEPEPPGDKLFLFS